MVHCVLKWVWPNFVLKFKSVAMLAQQERIFFRPFGTTSLQAPDTKFADNCKFNKLKGGV